jgi:hypothetical protein
MRFDPTCNFHPGGAVKTIWTDAIGSARREVLADFTRSLHVDRCTRLSLNSN